MIYILPLVAKAFLFHKIAELKISLSLSVSNTMTWFYFCTIVEGVIREDFYWNYWWLLNGERFKPRKNPSFFDNANVIHMPCWLQKGIMKSILIFLLPNCNLTAYIEMKHSDQSFLIWIKFCSSQASLQVTRNSQFKLKTRKGERLKISATAI